MVTAHPHEWVDWGAGLVLDEAKPVRVVSVQLELTWDEWYSSLILTDFPALAKGKLTAPDLSQVDTVYGLASPQRSVTLIVTYQGKPLTVKPLIQGPRCHEAWEIRKRESEQETF